jgi:heme ABC exporter ATP-binding subunit CcmA/heme exporter protein CcmB
VLTARRLGKRYGEKRVLRGIDLALPRGGFLVVTGPNGSGKTTLLRICAGLAQPTEGTIERSVARGQVGYLGHEPLVYRELTALENLELYGRLYRVPERRERIGMLLERFGLWEARHDRVAAYSRGMTQRLALCRVLLHEPELLVLDEPYSALDEAGAALLDEQLAELRAERTFLLSTHDPARVQPSRAGARPRDMSYVSDVGALARKDLLLELRARDTLPAMLLFVASVFVVFHFAVPGTPSRLETSGLLWVAILFTALLGLGRAFVPEREQRTMDGLVLAPCDRSAIWLAKSLATLAFLVAAQVVALPLYALFFHPVGGAMVAAVLLADLGICGVGTFLGAMAVVTRARDLLLPLLFLPLALPIVVGAVGASVVASPGRYLGFLALYDLLFAVVCWASFEYVVAE